MSEENLKHKTKKGLLWKAFESFANYGMQFVVGIVMARLLTPSDYGITALPAVFMAVAAVFIDSGFAQALIRKAELTEKDLSTSFYYSLCVGIFLYAVLFFASPFIADFYNQPVLTPLMRVTALTFLWGPLNTPQTVLLQRNINFKTPARISIVNKIVGGVVGITAAYIGFGLWALVISTITSSLLGIIQTWWAVKWLPKERFSKESFRYLWNFGNKMIGVGLISTVYANIAPIFLGKLGTPTDLGNYNRAKGYAALPSLNVTTILTSVSFPVLSKLQDNDEVLARNYRRMIRVSSYVVFPVMLLLGALARPLVITMLTSKWEACIYLLQIMCFIFMWQPINILNLNLLQVKGRTDLTLRLEIIKKIVGFTVMIISVQYGVVFFCYADLVLNIFYLMVNTYYTGKLIGVGYFMQMRDILPTFLLSLTMFLCILLLNLLIHSMILQIILGAIIGLGIYLGGTYLFKFDEINDVKYMLNRKK